MFLIVKLALVSSAFYVGITIALVALLLGIMHWEGGIFYSINFKAWALVFGLIWLASFALAWRVTIVPFLAKFPRTLRITVEISVSTQHPDTHRFAVRPSPRPANLELRAESLFVAQALDWVQSRRSNCRHHST